MHQPDGWETISCSEWASGRFAVVRSCKIRRPLIFSDPEFCGAESPFGICREAILFR